MLLVSQRHSTILISQKKFWWVEVFTNAMSSDYAGENDDAISYNSSYLLPTNFLRTRSVVEKCWKDIKP